MTVSMAVMHKEMHQRARRQQQERQELNDVSLVLRPEEIANHQKKANRDELGAGNFSLCIFRMLMSVVVVIHTFL
jgi:hypothetical protein